MNITGGEAELLAAIVGFFVYLQSRLAAKQKQYDELSKTIMLRWEDFAQSVAVIPPHDDARLSHVAKLSMSIKCAVVKANLLSRALRKVKWDNRFNLFFTKEIDSLNREHREDATQANADQFPHILKDLGAEVAKASWYGGFHRKPQI